MRPRRTRLLRMLPPRPPALRGGRAPTKTTPSAAQPQARPACPTPTPRTRCNRKLTLYRVACLWRVAGEKAQKKLKMETTNISGMQVVYNSSFDGIPRAEPLLERRPLVASNMPFAFATPLPMAGCGSWPLAVEARMQSAARARVLARVIRAP